MDAKELKRRQAWTLNQKIDHSLYVIESFISHFNGDVYVSFSGGKDSTVLLDLCRKVKPDIKAVFCNTGNEFPDIVQFVRGKIADGENIEIIHPAINPKKAVEQYGFPIHSKGMARKIYYGRRGAEWALRCLNKQSSIYGLKPQFRYLLETKYEISDYCCKFLKKKPFQKFEKETKLHPIIGTMAGESLLRQTQYLRRGGAIHLTRARLNQPRWRYGLKPTFGNTFSDTTSRLPTYMPRVRNERDACFAGSDVIWTSSDSDCCTNYIRNGISIS